MTCSIPNWKPYKFDTGMGILTLPRWDCLVCIAANKFMSCTSCLYKDIMIQHAKPIVDRMNEGLNEVTE